MSLKAEVELVWADGTYLFALKGAQIEELQRVCGNVGFGAIYMRVLAGNWFWGDLYHTARLGLVGGGMGAIEAKKLVDAYVGLTAEEKRSPIARGPNSPLSVAMAVLNATMIGMEDLSPGEAPAGESPATSSTSENTEQPVSSSELTPEPLTP